MFLLVNFRYWTKVLCICILVTKISFTAKIVRINVSISLEDFFFRKYFSFQFLFFVSHHLRTVILIAVYQYFSSLFVGNASSTEIPLMGRQIENPNLKTFSTSNNFFLLISLTKTILQKLNYKMESDLTQTNSSSAINIIMSIVGKPNDIMLQKQRKKLDYKKKIVINFVGTRKRWPQHFIFIKVKTIEIRFSKTGFYGQRVLHFWVVQCNSIDA